MHASGQKLSTARRVAPGLRTRDAGLAGAGASAWNAVAEGGAAGGAPARQAVIGSVVRRAVEVGLAPGGPEGGGVKARQQRMATAHNATRRELWEG